MATKPKVSKTAKALVLINEKGYSVPEAAKKIGIAAEAVYDVLRKQKAKAEGICWHCKQKMPAKKKAA